MTAEDSGAARPMLVTRRLTMARPRIVADVCLIIAILSLRVDARLLLFIVIDSSLSSPVVT
jgi:hypothetical protein